MFTALAHRFAAVLLALEALAILALLAWQVGALAAGDTDSIESAIALAVLTAVGALAVFAFAGATWRELSWGRSGGIVTQLLVLAVAGGALTGAYAEPSTAIALALPSVLALVLLVVAVRSAGRSARDAASDSS